MIPIVQWQTASPLWSEALKDEQNNRFLQPALLRFASDAFMDELNNTLQSNPALLRDYVVRPETWKTPPADAVGWQTPYDPDATPKLYQPAHQRFYLVGANLVCRMPGLPDRVVDFGAEEKVSFVVRRLVPRDTEIEVSDPTTYVEYGWFAQNGWQKIEIAERIQAGEERLPMFGLCFCANGRRRRMLAGFIPVANREIYQAAPNASLLTPPPVPATDLTGEDDLTDPRLAVYDASIAGGMKDLAKTIDDQLAFDGDPYKNFTLITLDQARSVFAFALLDLMVFLKEHLYRVFATIIGESSAALTKLENQIYVYLNNVLIIGGHSGTDVLDKIWDEHAILLGEKQGKLSLPTDHLASLNDVKMTIAKLDAPNGLKKLIENWVKINPPLSAKEAVKPQENVGIDPSIPAIDPSSGALYVVRCVYERPRCPSSSLQQVVSRPSAAFQLASFFDPDAPIRPIRIAMPIDTSIEGLRKFPKNVSFLLSDQLRKQVERVQGMTLEALDSGELGGEPNINLGMICTLSIPIITICALILLMIIVQLLNIVFWWKPFFKICFPLNLKA